MPSDATVQGSSFSPPTYFAAAAPVKPSMPRQRSGFGGFGARMSRVFFFFSNSAIYLFFVFCFLFFYLFQNSCDFMSFLFFFF